VAWGDGVQATARGDGRVILTSSGADRLVAEELPAGCEPPADPAGARWSVLNVGLAGSRPVVTYLCGDKAQAATFVYDVDGGDAVQIAGRLLTADEGHILLAAGGIYLCDLDRLTLARIGPGPHETQVGLAGGLVLWNNPGPIEDNDVVWKVARLPLDD
jgi:hypothetical protein